MVHGWEGETLISHAMECVLKRGCAHPICAKQKHTLIKHLRFFHYLNSMAVCAAGTSVNREPNR